MDNLNERDKYLAEQQIKYEEEYYARIVDDMLEEESLDELIAERIDYIEDSFDFEPSPAFEHLEEMYCADDDEVFQNHSRGIEDSDDYIDYIDYPDGPDENLNGVTYGEQYQEYEEIPDDFYDHFVEEAFRQYPSEDEYYEELANQHIRQEKDYLDHVMEDIIAEEKYFKKAVDELIFDEINLDYDPELFDYEDRQLGKIETVIKNYVEKDEKLDKVVKKKIKQKKF